MQEAVEGILHNAVTFLALDENQDIFDGVLREMQVAGGAGGVFRAFLLGAAGIKGRVAATAAAKQRTEKIREYNNGESKTRDRSPEAFAEHAAGAWGLAGVEDVQISAEGVEILYQEYADINPLDDLSGAETQVSGVTAQLTLEQYWALPQDAIEKLAPHTSFSAQELSETEAAERDALIEAMGGITEEEIAAERENIKDDDAIFTNIYNQIVETGGAMSEPASARAGAQQMAAVFNIFARKSGKTPIEVADEFLPTVMKYQTGPPQTQDAQIRGLEPQALYESYGFHVSREGQVEQADVTAETEMHQAVLNSDTDGVRDILQNVFDPDQLEQMQQTMEDGLASGEVSADRIAQVELNLAATKMQLSYVRRVIAENDGDFSGFAPKDVHDISVRINKLKDKLSETTQGSAEYTQLSNDLDALEAGRRNAYSGHGHP